MDKTQPTSTRSFKTPTSKKRVATSSSGSPSIKQRRVNNNSFSEGEDSEQYVSRELIARKLYRCLIVRKRLKSLLLKQFHLDKWNDLSGLKPEGMSNEELDYVEMHTPALHEAESDMKSFLVKKAGNQLPSPVLSSPVADVPGPSPSKFHDLSQIVSDTPSSVSKSCSSSRQPKTDGNHLKRSYSAVDVRVRERLDENRQVAGDSQTSWRLKIECPKPESSPQTPGLSCMSLTGTPEGSIEKAAKQEATVLARVAQLRQAGLWSEKRLPKCVEPPRARCHWDYLLEEARWMYVDFEQERKFKRNTAKKLGIVICRQRREQEEKMRRAEEAKIKEAKRRASFMAREVRKWWLGVEKVVEFRMKNIVEAKKRKALDEHLNFIVDQTEKFTDMVKESLVKPSPTPASTPCASRPPSASSIDKNEDDDKGSEFSYDSDEMDDDESTLDKEELDINHHQVDDEVAKLQMESNMDVDDVLDSLPEEYRFFLLNREKNPKESARSSVSSSPTPTSSRTSRASSRASSLSTARKEQPTTSAAADDSDTADKDQSLMKNVDLSKLNSENSEERQDQLTFIAEEAQKYQPKGYTLETAKVVTEVPFLLKHKLREYQHVGLDWLVTLHDKNLNGILADEMGLGKTIQTIALLAHLACDKQNWGPHLIVVPTSVILNWEMELKKWCPAFKILTYFGSQKDRKEKRKGWLKEDAFHVCITSYKLVVQDHRAFKSRRWQYFILDEAQNIKNFKSQRWQMLLNFNCKHRLLLTGTPLQNNLMELWSLMHFLMPQLFASHRDFKDWFSNPLTGMIEGSQEYNEKIVARLHKVLRPFLLRRLKTQVEKQMPKKTEEIIKCSLSKRQRFLYDEFMRRGTTKSLLSSGNMMSVLNVLMQLRKVCNHPNLFEPRPIITPLALHPIKVNLPSRVFDLTERDPVQDFNLGNLLEMEMNGESRNDVQWRMKLNAGDWLRRNVEADLAPVVPIIAGFKYNRTLPAGAVSITQQPSRSGPIFQINPNASSRLNFNDSFVLKSGEGGDQVQVPFTIRAPSSLFIRAGLRTSIPTNNKSASIITLTSTYGNNNIPLAMPASIISLNGNYNNTSPVPPSVYVPPQYRATHIISLPNVSVPSVSSAVIRARTRFHHPISITSSSQLPIINQTPPTTSLAGPTSGVNAGESRPMISVQPVNPTQPPTSYIRLNPEAAFSSFASTTSSAPIVSEVNSGETSAKKLKLNSDCEGRASEEKLKPINRKRVEGEEKEKWNSRFGKEEEFVMPWILEKEQSWRANGRRRLLELAESVRCPASLPLYGQQLIRLLYFLSEEYQFPVHCITKPRQLLDDWLDDIIPRFITFVPSVVSAPPECIVSSGRQVIYKERDCDMSLVMETRLRPAIDSHTHTSLVSSSLSFPETRLIQYDCGKLQTLSTLLRQLQEGGHRCLIFTQMSRVLDILESFLNHHGYIYLRLDGSTRIEHRQWLMERFNSDPRIFCFILSTRSGGIGVNLTGADTVIFYDSDWNPTMDAQAQDRAHRIGQTRDVTIYRLVSDKTVEENILKKAKQKQRLGELAIEEGGFTSEFFHQSSLRDIFEMDVEDVKQPDKQTDITLALANIEDESDAQAAKRACAEGMADTVEFDEAVNTDVDPEVAKVEADIKNIMTSLRPIERYAVNYLNDLCKDELDQDIREAEEELAAKRQEWIESANQQEENGKRESDEDDELITYSAQDEPTQMISMLDPTELWPIWMPPSPPPSDQEFDVYSDPVVGFWYETEPLNESDLPPVFNHVIPVKTPEKVQLIEKHKRITTPIIKETTNDSKEGSRSSSIDTVDLCGQSSQYSQGPSSIPDPVPVVSGAPLPSFAARSLFDGGPSSRYRRDQRRPLTPPSLPDDLEQDNYEGPLWTVIEDYAIMQAVTKGQQMAYNFLTANFGHAPNWDFISSRVNSVSDTYRSPRQCSLRFQRTLLPREDGRMVVHDPVTKKPYRVPEEEKSKRVKTGQLWQSEAKSVMGERTKKRFRMITKKAASRRHTISSLKFSFRLPKELSLPEKHAKFFNQHAINYDTCFNPIRMAEIRIERQKERDRQLEKDRHTREAQALEQKLRLSQQAQVPSTPPVSTHTQIRSQFVPTIRPAQVGGQHYVTVSQSLQGPPAAVLASTQISAAIAPSMPTSVSISIKQNNGIQTMQGTLMPGQSSPVPVQQVQSANRYVVGTVAYTLNTPTQPVQYVVANTQPIGRQSSPYRTNVTKMATPPSTPGATGSTLQTTQHPIRVQNSQIRPKLTTSSGSFLVPADRTTYVANAHQVQIQSRGQSLMRPAFQPSIVRRPSSGSLPKINTISRSPSAQIPGTGRLTRPLLSAVSTVGNTVEAEPGTIPSISNIVQLHQRDAPTTTTPSSNIPPQPNEPK